LAWHPVGFNGAVNAALTATICCLLLLTANCRLLYFRLLHFWLGDQDSNLD
jgi:hypothetical protein